MLAIASPNIDGLLLEAELLRHVPAALFVLALGACVGSFLGVVIHRLPLGMRLLTPASQCPSCRHPLRFFRENFPIIGWLALRGRCRYCRAPIPVRYLAIEVVCAVLFVGIYVLAYWVPPSTPFLGEIFGQWWHGAGIGGSLPMYLSLTGLLGGLLAMTIIDARTFTIPMQVPLAVTAIALAASAAQPFLTAAHTPAQTWPLPGVDWTWGAAAIGGMAGVLLSTTLLRLGVLRASFADYDDYVKDGETLGEYPHARREVVREVGFLLPAIIGFIAGWMIGYEGGYPPPLLQSLFASMLGYLVGAGLVWGVRILGTLAFGREAMGLGDVHLMGAVGAVLGWWDPILIFFIAPFSGLAWAAANALWHRFKGGPRREIPYGPHLAMATLVVVLGTPGVQWAWELLLPGTTMPADGLKEDADSGQATLLVDWTGGEVFDSMHGSSRAIDRRRG